jgi:fatty acid synthase subunit beta
VFSVRFLVVNAPYHSDYLATATERLCAEDLGGEELWTAKELGIPVHITEGSKHRRVVRIFQRTNLWFSRPGHAGFQDVHHTFAP